MIGIYIMKYCVHCCVCTVGSWSGRGCHVWGCSPRSAVCGWKSHPAPAPSPWWDPEMKLFHKTFFYYSKQKKSKSYVGQTAILLLTPFRHGILDLSKFWLLSSEHKQQTRSIYTYLEAHHIFLSSSWGIVLTDLQLQHIPLPVEGKTSKEFHHAALVSGHHQLRHIHRWPRTGWGIIMIIIKEYC